MITALLISSAFALVQTPSPTGLPETTLPDQVQTVDVAYEAVAAGRCEEAIQRIERLLTEQPNDPALLINLGAAYLAQGDYSRATDAYRRAAETDERYGLELADGRWMDSRLAARRALKALDGRLMAAR